jgi:DNA-binding response OmpR family regulator
MTDKAKVLVVDDTPERRLMLLAMLEDDYDVIEAESGEDCLTKIASDIPDVVFLDVHMPGMDGYEVCVKLRSQKETENLPVIFVSSLDSTEERLAGFEAGCDDYIIKPASYEVLIKR